jgi:hypothetical protein
MGMEDQDKAILVQIVNDYPIQDVMKILKEIIADRTDELSDLGLNDRVKEMSLVAWHLDILNQQIK